jgi:putative SOS response-associated peptidase YedK
MCGKFTQMYSWREVHDFSMPVSAAPAKEDILTATPMRMANILRLDQNGARVMVPMRWGFADKAANAPVRPKHMHARAETIDTRPTFREAFAAARGVLFVRTFNEGEELPSGKTRQWTVTPKDSLPVAIAVICEQWLRGEDSLWTFVMVTVPPNPLIAQITDRMPAILTPDTVPIWLGETAAAPADIKATLRTYDEAGNWDFAPA